MTNTIHTPEFVNSSKVNVVYDRFNHESVIAAAVLYDIYDNVNYIEKSTLHEEQEVDDNAVFWVGVDPNKMQIVLLSGVHVIFGDHMFNQTRLLNTKRAQCVYYVRNIESYEDGYNGGLINDLSEYLRAVNKDFSVAFLFQLHQIGIMASRFNKRYAVITDLVTTWKYINKAVSVIRVVENGGTVNKTMFLDPSDKIDQVLRQHSLEKPSKEDISIYLAISKRAKGVINKDIDNNITADTSTGVATLHLIQTKEPVFFIISRLFNICGKYWYATTFTKGGIRISTNAKVDKNYRKFMDVRVIN